MSELNWRKSTRSNPQPDCVEVAITTTAVHVRDSKACGGGPVLTFGPADWHAFISSCRDGEFA